MKLNRSTFKVWLLVTLAAVGSFSASAQTNKTGTKDFSDFKLIKERNVFDPNRLAFRPEPPPHVVIAKTFALTGTMRYENGLFAVFDGNNSEYHKILGPGGRIGTYTVGDINNGSVKLTSGTNEVELKVGTQMQLGLQVSGLQQSQ